MRIPSYIQRSRHGIFFFRIVVPRALRENCDGRWEIKGSLRTRNQRDALRLARPLTLLAFSLFDRMAAGMKTKMPTVAEIEAKAKAGELRDLKTSHTITLANGEQHGYTIETDSNDPAEIAAFERMHVKKQAELDSVVQRYRERPVAVPDGMTDYQRRQDEEMARYRQELAESQNAKSRNTEAALAAPGKTVSASDPNNTVSARWLEYVAQQDGGDWTTSRSVKANKRMFKVFQDWRKKDGDLSAITRAEINRFIKYLNDEHMVQAGASKGKPGLGKRTVDNHTSVLNKFLTWAQNKEYYPEDRRLPTADQLLVKKKARTKASKFANPAHTIGQLQTLFDPKNFHPNEAHHFWPPLIALYTGARRREVAQLLLTDFFVRQGITAMSINILEDEDKSVKSAAAIRVIPVHPALLNLGLMEYLEGVKALKLGPEVFPGIGTNTDGEKGNAIGNFWRGHMKKLDLFSGRSPTFHSFRSTALQELKDNGVSFEMRCQLAGHEIDHVSEGYNPNPFTLSQLMKKGIPKLKYEGLDLSGLKYKRGQFDAANRISTKQRIRREARIASAKAG
jgi:integrase